MSNSAGFFKELQRHSRGRCARRVLLAPDTGCRRALPDAQGRVVNSLVSTYRALGGGWQMRSGNSYVDPDTLNEMRERTNWGELLDN